MSWLEHRQTQLRSKLGRYPAVRTAHRWAVGTTRRLTVAPLDYVSLAIVRRRDFDRIPPRLALYIAYEVLLDRAPDPVGRATYLPLLENRGMYNRDLVYTIQGSAEYQTKPRFTERGFRFSIHAGRARFIQALPRAGRIVDLGGTDLNDRRGALVSLGYPYRFDSLTIVDLPSPHRHANYRSEEYQEVVDTDKGPVTYRYHSMVDLSGIDDNTVDLVYSGQSIEHVTVEDGVIVLKEVFRILKPGGHLAVDTPNARITRLQQDELIDPDHKVEYTWGELSAMLTDAGFDIAWAKGLNYVGDSAADGRFDAAEAAANSGLFDAIEDCYILAAVARKPYGP